jgi:hypothetical protein
MDESRIDWDFYLSQSIEFFNSWGDVLTWHPGIKLFRYEDLLVDPIERHKEILDFWGFDVDEDCVREAVSLAMPEEMAKRMPPDQVVGNVRLPNTIPDYKTLLSPELKKHLIGRLKNELIYDFGYPYEYDTEYDFSQL